MTKSKKAKKTTKADQKSKVKKAGKTVKREVKSVIAKSKDGTVQITFNIDKITVKKELESTAKKLAETLDIKGFRKGKAPLDKVMDTVDRNQLIQTTLNRIVPPMLDKAFVAHKLKPVMFPKIELLKAAEDSDWELRATTAEFPDIDLGDYKKLIRDEAKGSSIWTPEKAKEKEAADKDEKQTQAEKEQEIMKILLTHIKFEVPKVLVEEEVNARLSKLLDQIDKLGLNLDGYLKSVGKDADTLRKEYEVQSKETLRLELILNKIAESEKITVSDPDLEPYIKQLEQSKEVTKENKAQQLTYIRTTIRKRKKLEMLLGLLPA
jgi:FKBP-type peptidyl-prolyl cis-trans isomerase (trigger factor)